jgi:ribonuclease R
MKKRKSKKARGFSTNFAARRNEVIGTIDLTKFGYAFLIPQDPIIEDIYIRPENLNGAFHKDLVKINAFESRSRGKSYEGVVEEIINRGLDKVIGRFRSSKKGAYLVPIDEHIPLRIYPDKTVQEHNFYDGDICSVKLDWSSLKGNSVKGEIIENFHNLDDPDLDTKFVIAKNNLKTEFDPKILREISEIGRNLPTEDGKADLTNLPFITIDPTNAKDFDDAVYVEENVSGNWLLWVSIADVSSYVREDSETDREAFNRANSFYFPNYVVPMLPEEISNGWCSLSPYKNKLTMTVKIELTKNLSVKKYEIFESVMKSALRTNYDDVLEVVNSNGTKSKIPGEYIPIILTMNRLSQGLFRKRMSVGGIDFNLPEAKYIYNENGKIIEIERHFRNPANQIIEEMMLLANRCVSEFIYENRRPQIYRVHEEPDATKLAEFYEKARFLGYQNWVKNIKSSRDLNTFLDSIKDQGKERTLRYLLLRSMKQAKYSTSNVGHYGLSFDFYAHFTSPIRRYPDLITHRILKKILNRSASHKGVHLPMGKRLEEASTHSSLMERKAAESERDILKLKAVRLMQDKIGEIFIGYISGENRGGYFIELKDHMVEGFCPIENVRLPQTKKRYRGFRRETYKPSIGDQVRIKLTKAILEEGLIEFELLQ